MSNIPSLLSIVARCGVLLLIWAGAFGDELPTYTPQQLQEDLSAIETAIARTHPDIGHSVDPGTLKRAISDISAQLAHPMTRDEAWTVLTSLNPMLADGHLAVIFPGGPAAELERHLKAGGRLFPYNVHVDDHGELFIRSMLNGDAAPLAGARIEMLDGVPASEVAAKLLAHMNGDTPAFREALLSDRFAFWYWKFFGPRQTYRLKIAGNEMPVGGSGDLPLAYRDKSFEQLFRFDRFGKSAVLTIREFGWDDKAAFYEFTRRTFTRIREAGIETLVIDIRDNTGGDDDMWLEGVMPYIASAPFRNGSTFALKILEGRQEEGQKVGDVVRGAQEKLYQPQLDNPLRFKGKLYVLIGARTYSSAVLFANIVHDYDFGTIAGVGGAVRRTQSGGTQNIRLPNTQIGFVAPRFVLQPPSGVEGLLEPDLLVVDDPFRPVTGMETLLRAAERH